MSASRLEVSIGALFRDTATQVALLAGMAEIPDPVRWRETGIRLVEALQARLHDAGLPPQIADEIRYAQCAILDESALRRVPQAHDPARSTWEAEPLQVKYFGSYDAGDKIYHCIEALLRQSSPEPLCVEAYRLILGLGFLGRFAIEDDPARLRIIQALESARTSDVQPDLLVVGDRGGWWRRWRGMGPLGWAMLAMVIMVVLGSVLSLRLDELVAEIHHTLQG